MCYMHVLTLEITCVLYTIFIGPNVWLNNALWVTASAVVIIEEAIKQEHEFVCDYL